MAARSNFSGVSTDVFGAAEKGLNKFKIGQLQERIKQGDQSALKELATINPQAAQQIALTNKALNDQQKADLFQDVVIARSLPAEQRLPFLQKRAERLQALGRDPTETLAAMQESPEALQKGLDDLFITGQQLGFIAPSGDKGFTLNPGQVRFDSQGRPLAGVEEQKAGFTLSPGQQRFDASGNVVAEGPKDAAKRLDQELKISKDNFDKAAKLRKEIQAVSSDFRKVEDAFGRVEAATQDPSPAGDLALIFNFMKILDPGSVVRESEFATAQNAAAVPDQVRNVYNRVLSGERLNPKQRKDFVSQAKNLFTSQKSNNDRRVKVILGVGKRNGVKEIDLIGEQDFDLEFDPNTGDFK